jgi:hypothetical protein
VLIVINRKDEDIEFTIELKEFSVSVKNPKHSIQTLIIE